jgi:hypothetical protein
MHIANLNYVDFFQSAFPDRLEAERFVNLVENIPATESKAKIVLHQAARMIWLADRIDEFARARPALQLLFYLIAAEAIAKIVVGFQGESQSRKHVRIFFEEICSDDQRQVLAKAFSRVPSGYLTVRETIDLLYDIRCDVVHEGRYFTFTLPETTDGYPMITTVGDEVFTAYVSITEIRRIIIEGAVLGANKLVPRGAELTHNLEPV